MYQKIIGMGFKFFMKNKNIIFISVIALLIAVSVSCSDDSMQDVGEQRIVLDGKRFENLFMREHVEEVMQDARWPEYAVYARLNRNRCMKFQSIVTTPVQLREEYKKFQKSCYYLDEKTRCWIVMHVAKIYMDNKELPDDHQWEDDFVGVEKAVTRYLPAWLQDVLQ